ncbi:MAG: VCBS repeat-containing protein [Balneolaceae bacterium]|nr:MAG: VCBS repeat-containing protein [Balneolaceae bacterium]
MEEGGLFGIFSLGIIQSEELETAKLLYGTKLGGFFVLQGATTDSLLNVVKKPVISENGVAIRHPAVWMNMLVYPSLDGSAVDLIASGEGGMFYYKFQGLDDKNRQPVYRELMEVQQESAKLYKGSLIVPNVVDWNGNGTLDIVAGNAAGDLVFFENHGTNEAPEFAPAVHLESGGEPVLIKGGYRGSIQGPPEAHWGYTSPTVVDWNQNGLLDIVMNDARGMHTVYINVGTRTEPKLSLPKSLYLESLHLAGTWRTRPGAGLLDERMAYITLDTDDDVHLYWQHDKYNLEDGGKLLMENGETINANFLKAGGKGRAKFELVDWDGNGKIDLLIGTPRHATFPEPERGVPWSMNRAGAAVLLLRNVGTNSQPVYEYPAVMHFKGKPMHFGQHACSPTATTLGGGGLNILVGTETGEMIFFRGDDISFIQPDR